MSVVALGGHPNFFLYLFSFYLRRMLVVGTWAIEIIEA